MAQTCDGDCAEIVAKSGARACVGLEFDISGDECRVTKPIYYGDPIMWRYLSYHRLLSYYSSALATIKQYGQRDLRFYETGPVSFIMTR